jgi:acyl carrier protein
MKTFPEIMDEWKAIIADVLAIEPQEVAASSRLIEDLAAESIDILEMSFQCDKHFGIKLGLTQMAAPNDIECDDTGRRGEAEGKAPVRGFLNI